MRRRRGSVKRRSRPFGKEIENPLVCGRSASKARRVGGHPVDRPRRATGGRRATTSVHRLLRRRRSRRIAGLARPAGSARLAVDFDDLGPLSLGRRLVRHALDSGRPAERDRPHHRRGRRRHALDRHQRRRRLLRRRAHRLLRRPGGRARRHDLVGSARSPRRALVRQRPRSGLLGRQGVPHLPARRRPGG